jgi:hypothetical protein
VLPKEENIELAATEKEIDEAEVRFSVTVLDDEKLDDLIDFEDEVSTACEDDFISAELPENEDVESPAPPPHPVRIKAKVSMINNCLSISSPNSLYY